MSNCLYGGNSQKLCRKECTVCFEKSFAFYIKMEFWGNKIDLFKIERAIANGYTIIHMCQEEVLGDSYDWKSTLKNAIDELHSKPEVICLGNNVSLHDAFHV